MKHTNQTLTEGGSRMNSANKIIVSIALALVLCTGAALLAQAFFQAFSQNASGTVTVTPPEKVDGSTVYVKVASEADLIKATKDTTYNAPDAYSPETQRVIILLTDNISLTQDLLITRDCHIDLGSKTLDTKGHTITVYHTYTGAYVIANGTLKGAINVNTPNAAVLIDENSVNKTELTANVTAASAEAVRSAALSMVAAHLTNVLDDHGIYGMLTAGCTLPDFRSLYGCSHASGCCFLAEDPDLPYWFFGYKDLKFAYETTPADGVESLKVTVTYGGAFSSQTFMIHKVTTADEQRKAAAAIVLKELEPFYKADENEYNFSTPVLLPSKVALGNTTSVSMTYGTTAGTLSDKNGTKLYSPSETGGNLVVNGTTVNTSGSISSITETDYTKANRVVKELFGGSIVIQKSIDATTQAVSYTEQSLAYNPADFPASYDIDGISFSLVNNDQYYDYEITNGVLRVRKNTDGTYSGAPEEHSIVPIFLQATVLMHEDTDNEIAISISVPITCKDVQDPGGQVDQFLPYYYYFNRMFTEVTSGNYTYTSFRMPMKYASGKPEIQFMLVTVGENGTYTFTDATLANLGYLTITADTTTEEWVFTINPELIGLTDRPLTFAYRYRFNTNEDVWTIFSQNDGADGKYSVLTVPGVVNKQNLVETTQNPYTGFGDIPNPALYEFIYKIYHSEDEKYEAATDYILASRLTHEVNLKTNATDDGWAETDNIVLNFEGKQATFVTSVPENAGYDPFEGLELLDNALSINLANSGITIDELTYVAGMENLQYLNLANNGFKDGNNFTTDANLNVVSPLVPLTKLRELHLENNTLYDLSYLQDLESLETAYVYGNYPTVSIFGSGILSFIDDLLTDVVQEIYGSEGAVNMATFSAICYKAQIYNTVNDKGKPQLFSPSTDGQNAYSGLMNVEYQNKLAQNADISLVFENMSRDPEMYGLVEHEKYAYTLGRDGKPSAQQTTHTNSITFEYEGDKTKATEFYLVYHDFVSTDKYQGEDEITTRTVAIEFTVKFKFTVTRVDAYGNPVTPTN